MVSDVLSLSSIDNSNLLHIFNILCLHSALYAVQKEKILIFILKIKN